MQSLYLNKNIMEIQGKLFSNSNEIGTIPVGLFSILFNVES